MVKKNQRMIIINIHGKGNNPRRIKKKKTNKTDICDTSNTLNVSSIYMIFQVQNKHTGKYGVYVNTMETVGGC